MATTTTAYVTTSQAWLPAPDSPSSPDAVLNSPNGTSVWPPPAVFVKMEFGLSFGPSSNHRLSFAYQSRPFSDSTLGKRIPKFLVPGARRGRRTVSEQGRAPRSRSATQVRPGMPLALAPGHAMPPRPIHAPQQPMQRPAYPQHTSSLAQSQPSHPPPQHLPRPILRRQLERKPLPELPSRFRLGEAELPWTSPVMPVYSSPELPLSAISPPSATWPDLPVHRGSISSPSTPPVSPLASFVSPVQNRDLAACGRALSWETQDACHPETSVAGSREKAREAEQELEREQRSLSVDPERARELAVLHAAMLSIDALGDGFSEPHGSWDAMGEIAHMPRGPRDLGWAVRVEPRSEKEEEEKEPEMGHNVPWSESGLQRGREREIWQEYSYEEWERAGREGSVWVGLQRRRSWTAGAGWESQLWTYR